ncbi:MAG: hypothetical protein PVF74_10295 [Anaerolineales bacterium]|jgi:hypothetical protein
MKGRFLPDVFSRINYGDKAWWRGALLRFLPLLSALLLWRISIREVDLDQISDLGLVTVLPLPFYAALVLLIIGFVLTVFRRDLEERVLLLYVITLIFILHGTPQILYGTLRYSWAWKHVGIIDYIQRHGQVDPNVPYLAVYHNWPGFFILGTLFTEIMGFENALAFAGWAPLFFNLLSLGALLLLYRSFTDDQRLIWLGVWVFYLTNWVGQDYFSPQALGFYFYLVVIGICLHWFRLKELPAIRTKKRWHFFDRAVRSIHKILERALPAEAQIHRALPLQRVGLMAIAILLMAVLAATHQLTPFMAICALSGLVIFQSIRSRSLPILMFVLTTAWIFFIAGGYFQGVISSVIRTFGELSGNVDASLVDIYSASPGQRVVSIASRGLTLLVWVLAFLGFIRRLRAGFLDISAIVLACAPFVMLVSSSYGGEILFRVFLVSLAPMAFLAASLIQPKPETTKSWLGSAATALLSVFLLVGFSFAYFGKEEQYHFSENEVEAAQYLYSIAPQGTLLVEGARNYPSQFLNYEYFTYVPIDREPRESRLNVIEHPVEVLSRWLDNDEYTASFLIITRSQKAAAESAGALPPGSLDYVEQSLKNSQDFEVFYSNEDAIIFTLSRQQQ